MNNRINQSHILGSMMNGSLSVSQTYHKLLHTSHHDTTNGFNSTRLVTNRQAKAPIQPQPAPASTTTTTTTTTAAVATSPTAILVTSPGDKYIKTDSLPPHYLVIFIIQPNITGNCSGLEVIVRCVSVCPFVRPAVRFQFDFNFFVLFYRLLHK